jgi:predicted dehydrogenase
MSCLICSELTVGSFHPAMRRLKEIVDSGEIGTPDKD